jgi:hypothetical protein
LPREILVVDDGSVGGAGALVRAISTGFPASNCS